MSETPYNPNDPAFLLSRSLDEDLSAAQQEALDAALAGSESLRAEAEQLREIDRLIKRWGKTCPELDWEHYAALVEAKLIDNLEDQEPDKLDQLLRRWSRQEVALDARQYTASVMERIDRKRGRSKLKSLVFRIGLPLAAAASVAIAVTATFWIRPGAEPIRLVALGPVSVMETAVPDQSGGRRVVVEFGQEVSSFSPLPPERSGISFLMVGAGPVRVGGAELPP